MVSAPPELASGKHCAQRAPSGSTKRHDPLSHQLDSFPGLLFFPHPHPAFWLQGEERLGGRGGLEKLLLQVSWDLEWTEDAAKGSGLCRLGWMAEGRLLKAPGLPQPQRFLNRGNGPPAPQTWASRKVSKAQSLRALARAPADWDLAILHKKY